MDFFLFIVRTWGRIVNILLLYISPYVQAMLKGKVASQWIFCQQKTQIIFRGRTSIFIVIYYAHLAYCIAICTGVPYICNCSYSASLATDHLSCLYLVSYLQSVMAMHLFLPIVCSVQPAGLPCLAVHLYLATMPVPSHSMLYLLRYPTQLVIQTCCLIYSNYSLLYCLVCTTQLLSLSVAQLLCYRYSITGTWSRYVCMLRIYSMHTYLLHVPIQLVMPKSSEPPIAFQVRLLSFSNIRSIATL